MLKRLVWAVVVLAAAAELCLLLCFNPAEHAFFPSCLLYRLTGLKCPGCGMQRAIYLLLHGRLAESIGMCPMLYYWCGVVAVVEVCPRLSSRLGFAIAVVSVTFVYAILRPLGLVP